MMACCVPNCMSRHSLNRELSFHTFPKQQLLNKKWRNAIKVGTSLKVGFPRICSLHFKPDDYTHHNSRLLKEGSVPSLNLPDTCVSVSYMRPRRGTVQKLIKTQPKLSEVDEHTHELQKLSERYYVKMDIPALPDSEETFENNDVCAKENYEKEAVNVSAKNNTQINLSSTFSEYDFKTVKCLCNLNLEVENVQLILCSQCVAFQHCVCMGYLDKKEISEEPYTCYGCKNEGGSKSASRVALMRLALVLAYRSDEVPNDLFDSLSPSMRLCLIQDLKSKDILHGEDDLYFLNKPVLTKAQIQKVLQEPLS